ncbi:hypothetical protein Tdes44962_MAKER00257 [Teratosphaeria destructans]|uniref:Uncharacterized protein n=1 Tax=Teratosphaeria destructans TaxID=418781 RepID=A0A9W7SVW1_9PEZI|nr:hypothetical protein Tdes44962_MAKER00257 [Teratosphaeria destructans]
MDKLYLGGGPLYSRHGLDCLALTQADAARVKTWCSGNCIEGKPEFACMVVSSGCCGIGAPC